MSPRAASRLEALGFTDVYDYAGSKADWFANGLPREGASAEAPWAGDLAQDEAPTCAPEDSLGDVRERVVASGADFCVVVNGDRVVAGVLRGDALAKDPAARAEDVMELGPSTIRPSKPVETLLTSRSQQGIKSWIVASSRGVFLGVLRRDDAQRAFEESAEAP
jgi:CBS domain-containing protein